MKQSKVTIAVMGATGNAGRHIVRLLLEDPSVHVIACARSEAKLSNLESNLGPAGGRLQTKVVDVLREADVLETVSSADLVVGATSRSTHAHGLASFTVQAGASYYGVYLSEEEKWKKLRQLDATCRERGVMVIDDGGCHPGIPAAMVRLAANQGRLSEAWVGAKFGLRWDELDVVSETIDDFLTEMENTNPSLLQDGTWIRGYRHARAFDFGLGHGSESCIPMCLEEIRELARSGIVDSTGFFIAGFGPAVDYGVLPLAMGLGKIKRSWATAVLWWGLRRLASAEELGVIMLEGVRASNGKPVHMRVSHPEPYVFTAVPAVATIRQMVSHPRPGVWTQASFVEPALFFGQLSEMGVHIEK